MIDHNRFLDSFGFFVIVCGVGRESNWACQQIFEYANEGQLRTFDFEFDGTSSHDPSEKILFPTKLDIPVWAFKRHQSDKHHQTPPQKAFHVAMSHVNL